MTWKTYPYFPKNIPIMEYAGIFHLLWKNISIYAVSMVEHADTFSWSAPPRDPLPKIVLINRNSGLRVSEKVEIFISNFKRQYYFLVVIFKNPICIKILVFINIWTHPLLLNSIPYVCLPTIDSFTYCCCHTSHIHNCIFSI